MDSTARALRRQLIAALAVYAKPDTAKGLRILFLDWAAYAVALCGVLWLPGWPLKLAASFFMGCKVGGFIAVAHEAAHNAFVANRNLNWWIAVLTFSPALFNYRLWVFDHHALHHTSTNKAGLNAYQPLSLAQYQALGFFGKARERFFRSGNPLALGLYYLSTQWWPLHFFPASFLPERHRASALLHFFWLLAAGAAWFFALGVFAPRIAPIHSWEAIVFGGLFPFYVGHSFFSLFIYVQHTNPDIPWLRADEKDRLEAEEATFHLRVPGWFATLAHSSLEHPVHHLLPSIPCYNLREAQDRFNALLGSAALVKDFSFRDLRSVFRVCKLYDYERRQWLDFEGQPTSLPWNSPAWRIQKGLSLSAPPREPNEDADSPL